MKLDAARLCLDCEEIHEEQECPSCGSEAFAFLTRWVMPSDERRARPSRPEPPPAAPRAPAEAREQLDAYRQLLEPPAAPKRGGRFLTRGLVGLAAFGLAGWAWRRTAPPKGDA